MKNLMKTKLMRLVFGCTLALLACVSMTFGQTVTGAITGEVKDPTGAVVSGAQVVAHNLDTGVDTSTITNAVGFYRIEFLPIGHYQVKVGASGFTTATLPSFTLEVLQTANFNVTLTVGSSSTTVNVDAAAPILNTNDATLDSTFTANAIGNLPLNGLDFSSVSLYVPGSVNTGGPAAMSNISRHSPNDGFAATGDTPNINGNRAQANNYTLNGIDMNETQDNWMAFSPAPEALEEVKVITANSPTDFGNANGAGIVLMLKSGTNQFHGSVYGYVQDWRMNANSWWNNYENAINGNKLKTNSPYSQAQYGATIGGPILHDRLFFFADFLGTRHHTGGMSFASVMTQDMRNGDFSIAGRDLYDTQNGFAPYAGNKGLPILNPVAKYLFAHPEYYPLPNATPTDNVANNNYQADSRSYTNNNQGDIKIDYLFRPSDKISAFTSTGTVVVGSKSVLITDFPGENDYPTTLGGIDWEHTFSPSLVNLARIGFTRSNLSYSVPVDPTGAFGTKGDAVLGISYTNQSVAGFTRQNFGLSGVGTQGGPSINIENAYSYIDNLTWQHGLHFVSMGIQAIQYRQNYTTDNNNGGELGNIGYGGMFTASGVSSTEQTTGYGPADFVLDRVDSIGATLSEINVAQRQWRTAGYANDDYKIRPNLTLNLGLRYEFDEPWVEAHNRTGNIDLNPSDANFGQPIYAHSVPAGAEPGSGICKNRACYQPNYRQIMPHLGFAYQPADRWVVRGGYSATSFFEGYSYNQRLTSLTPFMVSTSLSLTAPMVGDKQTALNTPRTAEEGFSDTTSSPTGGSFNTYPQNVQPAYVQNWNLTLEYALTRTTSLQAGYVGGKGDHLADPGNFNQDKINGDPTSAPLYNNKYIGNNVPQSLQQYSIYPGNGGRLLITESRAMMNNNALQAVLRQRASHGLEFTVNYTYGKSMTNNLGDYSLNVNGYSNYFQNYYDSKADYGPSGSDIRHNLTGMGVYTVPVGRGQEYLHGVNRWMDEAVGGWKIGTTLVAYSGFAQSIYAGQNNNSQSWGNSRPNQYRKLKIVHRSLANEFGTDPSAQPCMTPGVDNGTCAFGETAPVYAADGTTVIGYKFGTASNGSLRGPGLLNVDFSAFKDFRIIEGHSIGFRYDAFNALNIASYGNPNSQFDATRQDTNGNTVNAFGYNIQNTRSTARNMQFSLHYRF
jgi:hypothetical protein